MKRQQAEPLSGKLLLFTIILMTRTSNISPVPFVQWNNFQNLYKTSRIIDQETTIKAKNKMTIQVNKHLWNNAICTHTKYKQAWNHYAKCVAIKLHLIGNCVACAFTLFVYHVYHRVGNLILIYFYWLNFCMMWARPWL